MLRCPNPNCASTQFTTESINIDNSTYSYTAILCKSCRAIIGVVESRYVPVTIDYAKDDIIAKLNRIEKKLGEKK